MTTAPSPPTSPPEVPASPGARDGASLTGLVSQEGAAVPHQPTSTPPHTCEGGNEGDDDAVTMLQAAFPGMDRTIIAEVLAAHGGSPDAASIALLEMSDPQRSTGESNVTTAAEDAANANRHAQLMSDEAYARELMEQMEREHQEVYGRPLGTAPPRGAHIEHQRQQQGRDYSNLNYIPRQRGGQAIAHNQQHSQSQSQYGNQGSFDGQRKDELEQLAEQFGKFADTGKKTFNSFLSKAKDKVAEIQQQRAMQAQQQALQSPGSGGSGSSNTDPASSSHAPSAQPTTIGGFTIPSIPAPWGNTLSNLTGKNRPTSPRDQMRTESPSSRESVMRDYSSNPNDNLTALPPRSNSRSNSEDRNNNTTYHSSKSLSSNSNADTTIGTPSSSSSPSASQPISLTAHPATRTLSTSPTPTPAPYSSSPSAGTRTGASSSPAKVQMLPRQPISLLDNCNESRSSSSPGSGIRDGAGNTGNAAAASSQSTGRTSRAADDDDDDDSDVEYVRNPFNDDD